MEIPFSVRCCETVRDLNRGFIVLRRVTSAVRCSRTSSWSSFSFRGCESVRDLNASASGSWSPHDDSGLPFSLAGLSPECRVSQKAKRFFAKQGCLVVMDLQRQEQQIETSPSRRARDAL